MTSKEISQRLKDVGFEAEYQWGWVKTIQGLQLVYIPKLTSNETASERKESIPAYDAKILFKWLMENLSQQENKIDSKPPMKINIDVAGIAKGRNYLVISDGGEIVKTIHFKTSLDDMLGEAIIWIKEQENE